MAFKRSGVRLPLSPPVQDPDSCRLTRVRIFVCTGYAARFFRKTFLVSPQYHRIPNKKTEPTYMSPVNIFGSIKAKCECF